jgi:hypothetical protein
VRSLSADSCQHCRATRPSRRNLSCPSDYLDPELSAATAHCFVEGKPTED